MKTKEQNTIVAAFETWSNGGTQTSSLYLASIDGQERVDSFIEDHYKSGTFAALHTFYSEDEAHAAFDSYYDDTQNDYDNEEKENFTVYDSPEETKRFWDSVKITDEQELQKDIDKLISEI